MSAEIVYSQDEVCRFSETVHTSLAFQSLLRSLEPGKRYRFMDLGRLSEQNITFLTPYASRIHLEDLSAEVIARINGAPCRDVFSELRELRVAKPVDVVLCWDLLNYLNDAEITEFGEIMKRLTHHGTRMFMLRPLRPVLPTAPMHFRIVSASRLAYRPSSEDTIRKAGPTKTQLQRVLPDFKREHSFLLRHGMEEHILLRTSHIIDQIEQPLSSVA